MVSEEAKSNPTREYVSLGELTEDSHAYGQVLGRLLVVLA
jgi:hypothetical protein